MVDALKKTESLWASSHSASRLLTPLADLFARLRGQAVALGFSAGADSAMLAVCAAELAAQYAIDLQLVHIHHGLMAKADQWVEQGRALATYLGLHFTVIPVEVNRASGLGMEAAAREARYQAFVDYAQTHGVKHFLLAHHLDDQAETLLLRLLRGSGVRGMRGMQAMTTRGEIVFYRPWLACERALILTLAAEFSERTAWYAVQDESNLDTLYKRGAVRVDLVPVLNQHWSSWKQNLSRHARLMTEAQAIMEDMAQLDWQYLSASEDQRSFCLKAWRALPDYRQSNVLRYWLGMWGLQMPTDKRLQDWLRQLREVHQWGFDREVRLHHEGHMVKLSKGRVALCLKDAV